MNSTVVRSNSGSLLSLRFLFSFASPTCALGELYIFRLVVSARSEAQRCVCSEVGVEAWIGFDFRSGVYVEARRGARMSESVIRLLLSVS